MRIPKIIPIRPVPLINPDLKTPSNAKHDPLTETQRQEIRTKMAQTIRHTVCDSVCPRKLVLDKDRIREILMRHGFTIKEGQTDLKDYVYSAVEEIISEVSKYKDAPSCH